MTATQPKPTANRFIKLYLALAMLINAYLTFQVFSVWRDLTSHDDPTLPHWPFLVLTLLGLGGIASLAGLWFWKKWGYLGYLSVNLLSVLVTLIALKVPVGEVARSLIGVGVFIAIFTPRVKQMR